MKQQQEKLFEELLNNFDESRYDSLIKEDWEAGIDEAGRGPVLGPMVYGIIAWPISLKETFEKLEFDDSKKLTEIQRELIFIKIQKLQQKYLFFKVHILDAEYLSNSQFRIPITYNLNEISHDTAINLISDLIKKGLRLKHIYVDTVGPKEKYQEKLYKIFAHENIDFTVSEKADSKYKVVSAASICAKVTRDLVIKNIVDNQKLIILISDYSKQFFKDNKVNIGSGYPADPFTKNWLIENQDKTFGYPNFVRFSWQTTKDLLKKQIEFEFFQETEIEHQDLIAKGKMQLSDYKKKQKYYSEKQGHVIQRFNIKKNGINII